MAISETRNGRVIIAAVRKADGGHVTQGSTDLRSYNQERRFSSDFKYKAVKRPFWEII